MLIGKDDKLVFQVAGLLLIELTVKQRVTDKDKHEVTNLLLKVGNGSVHERGVISELIVVEENCIGERKVLVVLLNVEEEQLKTDLQVSGVHEMLLTAVIS